MPTRNINLTPRHHAYVERVVKSGRYQNASEAVRDALRVLQQHEREQAYRLKILRQQVRLGLDALAADEFEDVPDSELEAFLTQPARQAHRRKRART